MNLYDIIIWLLTTPIIELLFYPCIFIWVCIIIYGISEGIKGIKKLKIDKNKKIIKVYGQYGYKEVKIRTGEK